MDTYAKRKAFSDSHIDKMKALLGTVNVREATPAEDKQLAIDFVTPFGGIAVRIRQAKWIKYSGDWVLRGYAPPKRATEYAKLLNDNIPHADYYLYAWVDNDEIIKAYLVNLAVWKIHLMKGKIKPKAFRNRDGKWNVAFLHDIAFSKELVS